MGETVRTIRRLFDAQGRVTEDEAAVAQVQEVDVDERGVVLAERIFYPQGARPSSLANESP